MFKKHTAKDHGFTLIELLVVIAIIAVLSAMLFPAVRGALDRAKYSKAKAEILSLAAAVKAYNNEYGKLPLPATLTHGANDDAVSGVYSEDISKGIINILTDSSNSSGQNPRRIVFLESDKSGGEFTDPWQTQYRLKLDTDYNNTVRYSTSTVKSVVVVVSFGSDKIEGGSGKDVTSFSD